MSTVLLPKTCVECSVEFLPKTSKGAWRAKYCSSLCRTRSTNRAAEMRTGERRRACDHCGTEFSYFLRRGRGRRFCSDVVCRQARLRTQAGGTPLCVTQGCARTRGYKSGLCNSCYYRVRRTGTVDKRAYSYRSRHSSGYVCIQEPTHPLAVNGRVFEHRKVLFEAIGAGHHPCHWCAVVVEWMRKGTARRSTLVVDHLDGDKANNARDNLVPSCSRCNWSRGLLMSWVAKHKDDPILWLMYTQARERTA